MSHHFHLFGMGPRRKLLYVAGTGQLFDAFTFEPIAAWPIRSDTLEPHEYRVVLTTSGGQPIQVVEDEDAVWLVEGSERRPLTIGPRVNLPRFDPHPAAPVLRALHAEILVHLLPVGPVPNLWVYPRPWYRDAALMLMCLQKTGNLPLVGAWVHGLHKIWDRNNSGDPEADNFGQVLYMLSLFNARQHPLVEPLLKALPAFHADRHIRGRTDYAEHPVYQTKWLKFGLRALGLDDPYEIPAVFDSYSELFWMDFREHHVPGPTFSPETARLYPYLAWAAAHFHHAPPPQPLPALDPPLTHEGRGSEADYFRLAPLAACGAIPPDHVTQRVCTPHTWHAAEIFLYLLDPTIKC